MDENQRPLTTREHQQPYGFDRQDRDLLIRLNTRVEDLIASLEKKDNILAQDIGGLKQGKLDKEVYTAHCKEDEKELENTKKVLSEHTINLTNLNRYFWGAMGIIAAIQVAMPFIVKLYFK